MRDPRVKVASNRHGFWMTRTSHAWVAALALALSGLALSALLSPVAAGCMCRNYTGKPFCAANIPACQAQAGNCMEDCTWYKSDEPKKKQKKKDDTNKKSMLIF
jgi:hypothetical protein